MPDTHSKRERKKNSQKRIPWSLPCFEILIRGSYSRRATPEASLVGPGRRDAGRGSADFAPAAVGAAAVALAPGVRSALFACAAGRDALGGGGR